MKAKRTLGSPRSQKDELADWLGPGDRQNLTALQRGRDWYWVLGNHDRSLPPSVGVVVVCSSLSIGHEPSEGTGISEIAGHLHPVARVARCGELRHQRSPPGDAGLWRLCRRALNVLDDTFSSLFHWHLMKAWLTVRSGVYPLQASMLLLD